MAEKEGKPSNSTLEYFKNVLSTHSNINNFTEMDDQQFKLERKKQSGDEITVYLIDLYTVGVADCMDIINKYPGINCIVIASKWDAYTEDAKNYAVARGIGLFDVKEFMGALHQNDFWNYVKRDN